jgi:hypothetical protein
MSVRRYTTPSSAPARLVTLVVFGSRSSRVGVWSRIDGVQRLLDSVPRSACSPGEQHGVVANGERWA